MYATLIQMALLTAGGIGWRVLKPLGLPADQTRMVLTSVVYYFFLPAMVLEVLWTARLGKESVHFSALAGASILFGVACIWCFGRMIKIEPTRFGAVMLAAAFPNVTYLGLPVLEQTFGSWARSVVIQIDLFATAPLVFTLGITIARHYGQDKTGTRQPLWSFLNAPPFWAAGLAVALNLNDVPAPDWLMSTLNRLSGAVVPLMLFSLGLALNWHSVKFRNIPYIMPVIAVKMLLLPLVAMLLVELSTMGAQYKAAAVLDLAMPSMVVGIVLCDRYRLDSALYAMAVTLTTGLSLFFLPFWHHILSARFLG